MTDDEFEVMDELYFVQSFTELQEQTGLEEQKLAAVLDGLLAKGWLRCLANRAGEPMPETTSLPDTYRENYFLASKAGLLAHNSR